MPQIFGFDRDTDEEWSTMLFNNGGGSGATYGTDGWPLFQSIAASGGMRAQAVEQIELMYSMTVEQMEIEPDSMGFGRWIGGPGVRLRIRPSQGAIELITHGDGCENPPHGTLGGSPGIGGGHFVESESTGRRRFVSAMGHVRVDPDEAWIGVSTGGGGYGVPVERDAEQVRQDARDGIISREVAREVFGVELDGSFDPEIQWDETGALRARLHEAKPAVVSPSTPGAGTWAQDNMGEGDVFLRNPSIDQ
jgi:N-methylhydantoinase B